MPSLATTSTHMNWEPRPKDIKKYFHFDANISGDKLKKLATNDSYVQTHAFLPLIRFREKWIKFRKNGERKLKSRPIRYCSRIDAAIFAYHRYKLSEFYENYLAKKGISNIPVAYRKIPKSSGGNKSNIELAKDAFDFIRNTGDCDVTVVDISSFFESLDHQKLRDSWEKIIGRNLSAAEIAVLNAVTKYSVVDIEPLFDRLNMFSRSGKTKLERKLRKIDKLKKTHKKRLATRKELIDLVCGGNAKFPSLIQKHNLPYGIPQGTPISDILANIYLVDFDTRLARWVRKRNGFAYRYSDDIIVIIPRSENLPFDCAFDYLSASIGNFGEKVKIKREKTAIGRFISTPSGQIYTHIYGNSCQNGIEYLGFQFNGKAVQLKNSTISNAWRKLKKRAHGWAKSWVKRYRNKGDQWLLDNAPIQDKATEVLRVLSGEQLKKSTVDDWTFISYVERAKRCFSDYETRFDQQVKKYKKKTYSLFDTALEESIKRNGSAKFTKSGGTL